MLGLPDGVTVCLFDLDGVLSQTATVHSAAWKATFDAFLKARDGDGFQEFTAQDYGTYVDGKPREDGVRDFLASRDIHLPDGDKDDPPTAQTVYGLGNRKNELLLKKIHDDGVDPYPGSVEYVKAAHAAGIRMCCVSSSANAKDVLDVTKLAQYMDGRIDGVTRAEQNLKGKPAPDTFLAGAKLLGVEPSACAVFEDALAGVEAGRAGKFGLVVGVDRTDQAAALKAHGADVVVEDLAELLS